MGKRTRKPARKSGWQQWTADEGREVVEAWRASGLPLATFARQRGLSAERVRWWRQRLGEWKGASGEDRPLLVPAVVMEPRPASAGGTAAAVTVRAAGDVVVEIADVSAVPPSWLSALVIALARPAP
jgi:hypothetical protein